MQYEYNMVTQFVTPQLGSVALDLGKPYDRAALVLNMGDAAEKLPKMIETLPGEKHDWVAVSHSVSFHVNTAVLSILLRRPA